MSNNICYLINKYSNWGPSVDKGNSKLTCTYIVCLSLAKSIECYDIKCISATIRPKHVDFHLCGYKS